MSKSNALAGLIGSYSESDDSDVENGVSSKVKSPGRNVAPLPPPQEVAVMPDGIQPAPIQHCPWSACYDEGSGFTYYWNQQTNAVTWEPPPEYLLALKIAQHRQHLMTPASGEVSAEEWQLYQQALAEKKTSKSPTKVTTQKVSRSDQMSLDKSVSIRERDRLGNSRKRNHSDDEQVKIELITSYDYNSESDSNDEAQSPVKKPPSTPTPPKAPPKAKNPVKKQKTKATVEYGPSLPPNQNYSMPIGPELPPEFMVVKEKSPEIPTKISSPIENKDDENSLLKQLKDKAKILEKLGGELPSEIQDIIKAETRSGTASPAVKTDENSRDSRTLDTNIDDLLDEIEKKELPKAKSRLKIDMFDNADNVSSNRSSLQGSPAHNGDKTPPLDEIKEMFPISKPMFPSAANITATELIPESVVEKSLEEKKDEPIEGEKKNLYLMDASDSIGVTKKKLRISNSVLPIKKSETPAYTTKYSSHIEGFSTERTGLGFSNNDEGSQSPKPSVAAYGTGLMFTKGETLNEDKKDDDDLDDLTDLVEAKLKYLNQLQGNITVTPVQEMLIQMQTLMSAFRCGALSAAYVQRRARAVSAALAGHERAAAPPGWTLAFSRYASGGRTGLGKCGERLMGGVVRSRMLGGCRKGSRIRGENRTVDGVRNRMLEGMQGGCRMGLGIGGGSRMGGGVGNQMAKRIGKGVGYRKGEGILGSIQTVPRKLEKTMFSEGSIRCLTRTECLARVIPYYLTKFSKENFVKCWKNCSQKTGFTLDKTHAAKLDKNRYLKTLSISRAGHSAKVVKNRTNRSRHLVTFDTSRSGLDFVGLHRGRNVLETYGLLGSRNNVPKLFRNSVILKRTSGLTENFHKKTWLSKYLKFRTQKLCVFVRNVGGHEFVCRLV